VFLRGLSAGVEADKKMRRKAFGQGAKFGTFALSPILGPIAPVLGRPFKNFRFPVFREPESINSCELSGKYRSQNLAYPDVSIPPPEVWKGGKPEF